MAITRIGETILVYAAVDYLLRVSNEVEMYIIAFGLFWVMTDLALFYYHYFIVPAAKTISDDK